MKEDHLYCPSVLTVIDNGSIYVRKVVEDLGRRYPMGIYSKERVVLFLSLIVTRH